MPHSESETTDTPQAPGQGLAVAAESLYLANMLLLPGPPFIALLYLYARRRDSAPKLALCHLKQTISASIWAVILLVVANAVIIFLGGYDAGYTWVVVVTYFVCAHAALVMLGMLGLAKAMAGRPWRFPLVGRPCD